MTTCLLHRSALSSVQCSASLSVCQVSLLPGQHLLTFILLSFYSKNGSILTMTYPLDATSFDRALHTALCTGTGTVYWSLAYPSIRPETLSYTLIIFHFPSVSSGKIFIVTSPAAPAHFCDQFSCWPGTSVISVACQTFLTCFTFLLVEEVSGIGQKPDPTFVRLLISDLNCGFSDNFSFGHCRRHMFWNIFPWSSSAATGPQFLVVLAQLEDLAAKQTSCHQDQP